MWAAMGGLGAGSGMLLGGLLTQAFGWPSIFLINIPVSALVIVLGAVVLTEGRREDMDRQFDIAGGLLVTLGLVAVTFGIVRTGSFSLDSLQVLGPVMVGVIGAGAVRAGRDPVGACPARAASIFRLSTLRVANVTIMLMYASQFAMWFFLTLFVQRVLHFDALEAGLALLPITGGVVAGSTIAPRLIARLGVRIVLTTGLLLGSGGLGLLARVHPGGEYVARGASRRESSARSGWASRSSRRRLPRSTGCRRSGAGSRRGC